MSFTGDVYFTTLSQDYYLVTLAALCTIKKNVVSPPPPNYFWTVFLPIVSFTSTGVRLLALQEGIY